MVEKLIATAESLTISGDYDEGKAMAYYEILPLIWNQAKVAGVNPADIGFGSLAPDALLGKKKAA